MGKEVCFKKIQKRGVLTISPELDYRVYLVVVSRLFAEADLGLLQHPRWSTFFPYVAKVFRFQSLRL